MINRRRRILTWAPRANMLEYTASRPGSGGCHSGSVDGVPSVESLEAVQLPCLPRSHNSCLCLLRPSRLRREKSSSWSTWPASVQSQHMGASTELECGQVGGEAAVTTRYAGSWSFLSQLPWACSLDSVSMPWPAVESEPKPSLKSMDLLSSFDSSQLDIARSCRLARI